MKMTRREPTECDRKSCAEILGEDNNLLALSREYVLMHI